MEAEPSSGTLSWDRVGGGPQADAPLLSLWHLKPHHQAQAMCQQLYLATSRHSRSMAQGAAPPGAAQLWARGPSTSPQPGTVLGNLARVPPGGCRASARRPETWLLSQGCRLRRPASDCRLCAKGLLVLGLAHPEPADKCPRCILGGWPQPRRPCRAQASPEEWPVVLLPGGGAPGPAHHVLLGVREDTEDAGHTWQAPLPALPTGVVPAAVPLRAGQDLGATVRRRDTGKDDILCWQPAPTRPTHLDRLSVGSLGVQPWPEEGGDLALSPPRSLWLGGAWTQRSESKGQLVRLCCPCLPRLHRALG